jgi:hypothetical protein
MDTKRTRTDDEKLVAGLDAAKAVAQLECANRRLLYSSVCAPDEIEVALAERDEAVRAIAAIDPAELEEPLAERLQLAFEDGRRIRQRLAVLYRGCDGRLKRFERINAIPG